MKAQLPVTKESIGTSSSDGKRPDSATLISAKHGTLYHPRYFVPPHVMEQPVKSQTLAYRRNVVITQMREFLS